MDYFKIPSISTLCDLRHADVSIFQILCLLCFRYSHGDGNKEFWITDRDLAVRSKTSTKTVFISKRKLKKEGLIDYRIGPGNKTHYRLISLIDDSNNSSHKYK